MNGKTIGRLSPATVISLIALFLALGGTSIAASTLVAKNSVGSAQVINGSLKKVDLSKKTVAGLRGKQGSRGPAGTPGTAGPAGATGPAGTNGPAGTPGATGPTGATGPAGASGPAGNGGVAGATGPGGDTGPRGATGPSTVILRASHGQVQIGTQGHAATPVASVTIPPDSGSWFLMARATVVDFTNQADLFRCFLYGETSTAATEIDTAPAVASLDANNTVETLTVTGTVPSATFDDVTLYCSHDATLATQPYVDPGASLVAIQTGALG